MRYIIIVAILVFGSQKLVAQKNIDGLARAERSFAAYAVANGIKPAFLQFADSNGILFDQGKPVNALRFWNSKEARSGILNWRPDYVEIAASHDFGFSTGPWTFQPNSLQDSITGKGRFVTIWQINNNGEWKYLVDLGVSNIPTSADTVLRKIEITDPSTQPGNSQSLMDTEKEFIIAAKQSLKDAYSKYLSTRTLLTRNGMSPGKTQEEITAIVNKSPHSIQYFPQGSGIAASGDVGYVYGTTVMDGKSESYLHIWRKENDGWRIALEVLRL